MTVSAVWLIGLAIGGAIVAVVVMTSRRARLRTEAMGRLSLEMGFSFDAVADLGLLKSDGELPLYHRGHSARAKNRMSGRVGDDQVSVFDFQCTVGGGKNQHIESQSVALFPGAAHALPDLQLAPENVFHKIGQVFGYQDIDFESNPDFSNGYLVRGPDETAIRAALHAEAQMFFVEHQGWTVEVRSGTVGIYRAGKLCSPDEIRAFLDEAHAALGALRR